MLESVISRFPIVVIDENTYNAIKNYSETDLLVKKDKNDRHYLDIFAPLCPKFSMSFSDAMFAARKINKNEILDNIMKNRKKFEYDAKNYEKYGFLLREYREYEKKMNTHNKDE